MSFYSDYFMSEHFLSYPTPADMMVGDLKS